MPTAREFLKQRASRKTKQAEFKRSSKRVLDVEIARAQVIAVYLKSQQFDLTCRIAKLETELLDLCHERKMA